VKEQIIHLDPLDDYSAVRDKMGWAQTDRILLVVPTQGRDRLFKRQLDLLLTQRHAATLGAKLACAAYHRLRGYVGCACFRFGG
jgi:hypothetical protein